MIPAFFDTNVLFYALVQADRRKPVAESLLLLGGIVSVQVLNELASATRGKLKMSWGEIQRAIEKMLILCPSPLPLTLETHQSALRICDRYGFSIWDGFILASALEAGCTTLYTEDLQHGQVIEELRIENPFLPKGKP